MLRKSKESCTVIVPMNPPLDPEIKEKLDEENLRYISDKIPGIFRQEVKDPFEYYDTQGNRIKDKETLNRIKALTIPPAWSNVWISPIANGHLQATGIDEKGRKQYLYHPDWTKISQENKFSKMTDFGLSLSKIRRAVGSAMKNKSLDKIKILATIVWLLEHTFIRIGNEEYSKENNSFGLTTLRNRHVEVKGEDIKFEFKGKSGVYQSLEISHPIVAKTIKKCIELPGYELFQYVDEDGKRHAVDSADVNEFLKELTHDDFSAKDFRTWGASNLSANLLYKVGYVRDKKMRKKNISETVKQVASHLNNTVSVCRNYYIHPTVIETYQKDMLSAHFEEYSKSKSKKSGLSWDEYALITLLQKYPLS